MIEGKPTVFISYSEAEKSTVAIPFREYLASLGLYGILVGEEPLPEAASDWDPEAKVTHFLDGSQMFVALATPDETVKDGKATRQNIIDEIRMARERSHLRNKIQIFKAPSVDLPSNINPTHDPLDPEDIAKAFPVFKRQAREYQLLKSQQAVPGPEEPSTPEPDSVSDSASDGEALKQAAYALKQLATLLQGTDASDLGSVAARAHLASSTALATARSADLLGAHEINGLYRDRTSVTPTHSELSHLLRTIVANVGAANAPGWYWLRSISSAELQSRIVTLAIGDSDDATKRAAIDLLRYSPNRITPGELRSIVMAGLANDASAGSNVLALLERHGSRRDLKALREGLEAYSDRKAVHQAQLTINSRETPTTALQHALDNPAYLNEEAEKQLLIAASKIPDAAIQRALLSSSPALRRLAIKIQNSTSTLRKVDVAKLVTDDPDSSVRTLAAELAIKRHWRLTSDQLAAALKDNKWEFDRVVSLHVDFWALEEPESSLEKLDWFDVQSVYIYEALARKHFDAVEHRIDSDLESDFAELKARSRERLEKSFREATTSDFERRFGSESLEEKQPEIEKHISAALEKAIEQREDVQEFILKRFRIAALAGLAENGTTRHLPLARRFLNSDERDLVRSSIELIERVGDDGDVPILLSIATNAWGDIQKRAADAALTLATEPVETALELLESTNPDVVRTALDALSDVPMEDALQPVWDLLRNDHLSIRDAATDYFIKRLQSDQLRYFPTAYSKGQYYYSVVARVDRELYAPGWLRRGIRAILGS